MKKCTVRDKIVMRKRAVLKLKVKGVFFKYFQGLRQEFNLYLVSSCVA